VRYHNVKLKDWRFVAQAPPTPTPTWYTDLDVASDITDNFDSYAIFSGALSTACWTMGTEHYKFGTAAYRHVYCNPGGGCSGYNRDHLHILKSSVLGQEFIDGTLKLWGYHCTDGGASSSDQGLFGLILRFVDSNNFIVAQWGWPWNGTYHVCPPKIIEYNGGSGTLLAQGSSINLTDNIWYLMTAEITEYSDHLEIVSRIYDNDGNNLVQEISATTTTAQFRNASSHLCGFRMYLYGCNVSSLWLNHFADRFEVWI